MVFLICISTSVWLLTSCFMHLGYLTGLCSAICVFTSVILVILTYCVMSTQDTHYLHLTWKPNRNFMALESGMSAVCLVVLQPGVNRALLQPGNAGEYIPQQTPNTIPSLQKVLIAHGLLGKPVRSL